MENILMVDGRCNNTSRYTSDFSMFYYITSPNIILAEANHISVLGIKGQGISTLLCEWEISKFHSEVAWIERG